MIELFLGGFAVMFVAGVLVGLASLFGIDFSDLNESDD
jgi:hypothetical protein